MWNEIQNKYLLGFLKSNLETFAASISTQGIWFVSLTDFMPLIPEELLLFLSTCEKN